MGPLGWEFTYDAVFQVLFAIITLAIGFFALKIYRYTKDRKTKNLGLSFLSIAASFIALSFLNFNLVGILTFLEPEGLMRVILSSYMGLYIVGAITLAYVSLNLDSDKAFYMMVLITFIAIIAATHKLYLFYSIATILFGYVFIHYASIFKKKKKVLLVMLGFGFLFLANLTLIFSMQNQSYYILGHFLELIGYCLMLINFVKVLLK